MVSLLQMAHQDALEAQLQLQTSHAELCRECVTTKVLPDKQQEELEEVRATVMQLQAALEASQQNTNEWVAYANGVAQQNETLQAEMESMRTTVTREAPYS